MKTLVIGIGNVGRADDGLGWAFVDKLSDGAQLEIQYRYQLQVEDAELISNYEEVFFVDASHTLYPEGFILEPARPEVPFSYTSHALPPSAIMYLCEEIYGFIPRAYVLGISGEDWGLRNGMSDVAQERLERAYSYFIEFCTSDTVVSEDAV